MTQTEARRRRRFRLASRATLGNGIGAFEGFVAALLSLMLSYAHEPLLVLATALAAGATYGVLASGAARKFLAYSDLRQPFALHAALSWPAAAAVAFLVALAASRWNLAWGRTFWVWLFITPVLLTALRVVLYRQLARMLAQGQLQVERFGIIGEAAAVARLRADPRIWQHGGQVVTSLILPQGLSSPLPSPEVIASFARKCIDKGCQHVLLIGDLDNLDALSQIVAPCRPFALNVLLYPRSVMQERKIDLVDIVPLASVNSVRVLSTPLNDSGLLLKRGFDIVLSLLILVLLSPLLLGVALAIRLTSPGAALYRQERRGFNGRNFYIYKFRSMRVMEDGRAMRQAQTNDPRITPIGRFIRRTSIDELPQLINVLRGEMSLVGPRPHAISHDDELSGKFELYAQRQRIKPGITGWAQVNGYRGDTSTQDKIEGRTLHDLYYMENCSLLLDLWIILLTVFSPRTRQNAH
ncbi:exopolysaccharide biosynthesis polyprenyl glycosylphosphotransferase [Devosia crocina]|nr:exopolysaccharide biosynthesis polyprenyl glycosylphosphotransferase [Devosia crocina]